jgi:hypothetical protein
MHQLAAVVATGGATGAAASQVFHADVVSMLDRLLNCPDPALQLRRFEEALRRADGDDFIAVFTKPKNTSDEARAQILRNTPASGICHWLTGQWSTWLADGGQLGIVQLSESIRHVMCVDISVTISVYRWRIILLYRGSTDGSRTVHIHHQHKVLVRCLMRALHCSRRQVHWTEGRSFWKATEYIRQPHGVSDGLGRAGMDWTELGWAWLDWAELIPGGT